MRTLPPVLDTGGPTAEPVATLSWVLFIGAGAILALVVALMLVAFFGPASWKRALASDRTIIVGGLAFPVVTLSALLVVGLAMTASLASAYDRDALTIRVTGERWWWRLDYPGFRSANELVIPTGQPVNLELRSDNVLHSFWVPALAGKRDMIPGRDNRLTIIAERPGTYYGICTEYCGGPHALMQFKLHALRPADYALWAANQRRPAAAPEGELAERGAVLFQRLGCGGCHRVAGTRADGWVGPDLTHLATRTTLGAGILPNNVGTLGGWTANPHTTKPGVLMPAYTNLSSLELRALAEYMDGLQ